MKIFIHLILLTSVLSCKSINSDDTSNTNNTILNSDSSTIAGQIVFPVDNYQVTQSFGNLNNLFGNKYHCADDVVAGAGDPIKAFADGVVSYSGPMGGYGWLITIYHEQLDKYSLYGHLSTRREKVAKDDSVTAGQVIAFAGDDDEDGSGPADGSGQYVYWGPHLHFSIREGKTYDYSNRDDDRWMAGYTTVHPSNYGWINPKQFIETNK